MVITITTGCEGSVTKITVESLTLMNSSDVLMATTTGFEGGFTKVTVESLTMMGSSDVVRTTFLGSIAFITKDTVKFFSLMDSSDLSITISNLCEGSVTFTATMYFLHFYLNTGELLMVWCSILYCYILRSTLCRVV